MKRHPTSERRAPRNRRYSRAFTLIEILVALSAGVLVSLAAFSLSKSATAFFQHEARISAAQLAVTLGLNRLTTDISRASFLASPNVRLDPMVCRTGAWPLGLNSFAGINISAGTALAGSQAALNSVNPDKLVIGGSLDSSEVFTVQCVLDGGGSGPRLQLQEPRYDNAMARVLGSLAPSETLVSRLNAMFGDGRFVQLLDPATGFRVYGLLNPSPAVTVTGAGNTAVATVQLDSSVALPTKPSSTCGIIAPPQCGAGLLLSVISRVEYEIVSLQGVTTSPYYSLVTAPAGVAAVTGDAGRTELTRVELGADDTPKETTRELVAEYAVDMRFGLTVASKIVNDVYEPTTTSYGIGNANVYTVAGNVSTSVIASPQRIRALQVRLAARTRAPDRSADLPAGLDGRRLHYNVGTAAAPMWARVRTAYATVGLPNQGGFSLW